MGQHFEVQGELYRIGEVQSFGQNGFTKREFVVKLTGEHENPDYPNYIAFELIKDKCALIDSYQVGQALKVYFNLNGRLWSAPGKPERCFTSLQAWRLEPNESAHASDTSSPHANENFDDDIPF